MREHPVAILAFDFGEKNIGVAVGDTQTRLASALSLVSGPSGATRMAQIEALVRQWSPDRLIVGLPLTMDGEEQDMSARSRRFARQLGARFRLPVELADERLSSVAAESALRETGRAGRRNQERVHAEAARIILQSYLDDRHAASRR